MEYFFSHPFYFVSKKLNIPPLFSEICNWSSKVFLKKMKNLNCIISDLLFILCMIGFNFKSFENGTPKRV